MKLNKFQVSAVFYFKSGNSKKVDWIEERLVKKIKGETQEVTEPLTLEEADAFFQGKFKEWKDKGTTVVRKNAKGENSVIPFSEVEYVTFTVTSVEENKKVDGEVEFEGGSIGIKTPPFNQSKPNLSEIKDITQHPAYKPPKTDN